MMMQGTLSSDSKADQFYDKLTQHYSALASAAAAQDTVSSAPTVPSIFDNYLTAPLYHRYRRDD